MEEQQFDTQALTTRAADAIDQVRKSEAYPALIGGIAGGIAGALMAVLIAGRATSRRVVSQEVITDPAKAEEGLSVREIVQLATVVASLVRQAQEWYQERRAAR